MDVGRDDEFDDEEEFTPGRDLNSTDDGSESLSDSDSNGDEQTNGVTNEELAAILLSRTVPRKSAKDKQKPSQHQAAQVAHEVIMQDLPTKRKWKGGKTTSKGRKGKKLKNADEVEAGLPLLSVGDPPVLLPSSLSHSQEVLGTLLQKRKQAQAAKSHQGHHREAIYLFFKEVYKDKNGNVGMKGTKFYQSIHGTIDVVSVTAKMNSSQTGMEILRSWRLIHHLKKLSLLMYQLWLNIKADMADKKSILEEALHMAAGMPPINANRVTALLASLRMAALGFQNENNSFISQAAELEGKVNLSLDAWTSSNGYAFLAIVMHYVIGDWKLEEVLLEFQELIGEHSGENMAGVVWDTLDCYGLKGRIQAIASDNATNNDTMMESLENHSLNEGLIFDAIEGRIHCVPHTVHLVVLELLEGLGLMSAAERKASEGSYQETTTTPVDRSEDLNAVYNGADLQPDDMNGP
ncbi:hypothetical protein PAXRUDRAFT_28888, partial [Paxillus rubicundulus Ve08.2h10]